MPSWPTPDRRLRIVLVGVLVVGALVVGGLVVWLETRRSPAGVDARATEVSAPGIAAVGSPAPTFTARSLSGGTDVRFEPGRPTVVTFWASWCAPCRKEFPLLVEAQRADPELQIVGVVYKDIPADARLFASEVGAPWPNALDPQGTIAGAYGVRAIPQTFFVDRTGVIRARVFGVSSASDLERDLATIR